MAVNLYKLIDHTTRKMHGKEYSYWEYENGTYLIVYFRYSNGSYKIISSEFFPIPVPVKV